jgi:hypothetical protein
MAYEVRQVAKKRENDCVGPSVSGLTGYVSQLVPAVDDTAHCGAEAISRQGAKGTRAIFSPA